MEDNYREFYQLGMCESYLSDGIYIWEDFAVECDTLEQCFGCLDYAQTNPEFTDFKIEFRQVTVVIAPSERCMALQ